MKRFSRLFSLGFLLCASASALQAQHDAHRNATQHIAAEKFDKAAAALQKAADSDPETHFVRMMLALKQENPEEAVQHAQTALETGLPFDRLVSGPRELLDALHQTREYQQWRAERPSMPLVHGPMLGRVSDSSASFWVRTAEKASVQVRTGKIVSEAVETKPGADFTAIATLAGLKPATPYTYEVLVNGEPAPLENAKFRTFPKSGQAAQFSVGFGGGAGYVPKWERMWDTILTFEPIAFFMLGDNVYIDQPEHTLCQHYCYHRRQSRPEWRRFTAATNIYAIYDDHDFGTNDCMPGPEIEKPAWKRPVLEIFRQNWVNPAYGGGPANPGCWFDASIGDVQFFFLDGRYYRDRGQKSMLGPVQKNWLLEGLKASQATFKVIASPVPFTPGIKPGSKDPWDGYPEEREEIFAFVEANRIPGVFLIAADRHRTDLRVIERENGYDFYEFESSRLTNRHTHKVVPTPGLIWGYNQECSFGLMRFDTTQSDPSVTFEAVNIDGEVIHSHVLRAGQLR